MASQGRYRKPPDDLVQVVSNLMDRVSKLERNPQIGNTSIDKGDLSVNNGGNVTIDGGNFTLTDPSGTELVKFGDIGNGALEPGWMFRRSFDGTVAFFLNGSPMAPQYWGFADMSGNLLMSDDVVSAQGLATPYLTAMWTSQAKINSAESTTTSGTFSSLYRIHYYKWHPRINCWFIATTPAGVTAEVRLVDALNGNALVPNTQQTIPANSFGYFSLTGNAPGGHGTLNFFDFQMRVASGAGTVGITLVSTYGVASP